MKVKPCHHKRGTEQPRLQHRRELQRHSRIRRKGFSLSLLNYAFNSTALLSHSSSTMAQHKFCNLQKTQVVQVFSNINNKNSSGIEEEKMGKKKEKEMNEERVETWKALLLVASCSPLTIILLSTTLFLASTLPAGQNRKSGSFFYSQ